MLLVEIIVPEPEADSLKSIIDQISTVLQIDRHEKSDAIINDLLQHGQESLTKYQNCGIPDTYTNMTDINDSELIKQLKSYHEGEWKRQYLSSNPWFVLFLNTIQLTDHNDMYQRVLIRTAKYGNRFMKNFSILSIILQILFEGINDRCLEETNLFNELWFTTTMNGIKSIIKYSQYIIGDVMNKQMNEKDSILFRSLREYYRQELIPFFQQMDIKDRQNLHESALDNLTELGWRNGLETIRTKILPDIYKNLSEQIDQYLQSQEETFERQGNLICEVIGSYS